MVEVKTNSVFVVDIDGTINDCSIELKKWKVFCGSAGCSSFRESEVEDLSSGLWCGLEKGRECSKEALIEKSGIFDKKAIVNLPPLRIARDNLWKIFKVTKNIWYVSGRPENQRVDTLNWLQKNEFPMCSLRLRSSIDKGLIPDIKATVVYILRNVYGKDGQQWFWIDDDERIREKAESLGIEYLKAPECWNGF